MRPYTERKSPRDTESPAASLTVPLLVRGHVVGVATWDVYGEGRTIDRGVIAFAQASGAGGIATFPLVHGERMRDALQVSACSRDAGTPPTRR